MKNNLAERVVKMALNAGATQVAASIAESTEIEIVRRDGQIEEAKEATSRGLSVTVLVDDRYAVASTSDLRPDAVENFVKKVVKNASVLEPEPERRFADLEDSYTTKTMEDLDLVDLTRALLTAEKRAAYAKELEEAVSALRKDDVISAAVQVSDGGTRSHTVSSTGFQADGAGTWFAAGGEMSLRDGDKIPESYTWHSAVHRSDLPSIEEIAQRLTQNTRDRVGAAPLASGRYPMILRNDTVGRLLGMFLPPLSGRALFQQQSCFLDALGSTVGSEQFTLLDDPWLKRGMGSALWSSDAIATKPRTLVDKGVLKDYNIGLYHARKLGVEPTGSLHNLVIPPGDRAPEDIAKDFPQAILVTGFLGGNSNPVSGDFSLGISGTLLENGVPTKAVSEMNVSGNVKDLFTHLSEVANDPWPGNVRSPALLFTDIQFSGS